MTQGTVSNSGLFKQAAISLQTDPILLAKVALGAIFNSICLSYAVIAILSRLDNKFSTAANSNAGRKYNMVKRYVVGERGEGRHLKRVKARFGNVMVGSRASQWWLLLANAQFASVRAKIDLCYI